MRVMLAVFFCKNNADHIFIHFPGNVVTLKVLRYIKIAINSHILWNDPTMQDSQLILVKG